ncbi:MAG: hypothetical protein JWN44_2706 [Myxococcales bacterium]|nr:hypothetical protein [Myxococcales bacterium]
MWRSVVATLALMSALLAGGAARAQTCEDDVAIGPNRVYVQAADTQVPILKALGKKLRAQATPTTIIYSPNGSCSNLSYVYSDVFTPNATAGGTFYIPADPAFDPKTSPVPTCQPVAGQQVDLGISIVFPDATNCPMTPVRPAGVAVTQGPVQAFVFAVPGGVGTAMGSTQQTITAEEAYLVMGLGAMSAMVPPWGDPTFIFGRPASKGTQISIGANISVPASKWKLLADTMHQIDQSSAVATAIASHLSDGNAEKTLGILGTEIYDQAANRANLHSLAFRAFQQLKSYWPDSSPNAFDKKNVRDGHYPLWSYVQYVASMGSDGKARKAGAQTIIDMLVGSQVATSPAFEPLDVVINAGLVPACAMKVKRSADGGPQSLVANDQPCGCYFDAKAPMGATSCTACTDNSPCGSGMCRHGYCEAK